jgi:nicotinamidase-related amidase
MHTPLELPPAQTALVLIDLQAGIVRLPAAPHSVADVVERCGALSIALRAAGGLVVHVRVVPADRSAQPVDAPPRIAGPLPPDFADLIPDIRRTPDDLVVTKNGWNAFHATDLENSLRAHGIETVVLGGIATNIGVESTARDGYARGFAIVLAEDACTTYSAEAHAASVEGIFPRLARVRSTETILDAFG